MPADPRPGRPRQRRRRRRAPANVSHLDTEVVVIDPRGRFLTRERFGDVRLDDRWPDETIASLRPDSSTASVTLSHDPKFDDFALIAALGFPTGYVGALGSRRSHAARLRRLAKEATDRSTSTGSTALQDFRSAS